MAQLFEDRVLKRPTGISCIEVELTSDSCPPLSETTVPGEILPFGAVAKEFKPNRCTPMDTDDGLLHCTPQTVGQTPWQ
jgi:hypothetical protein